MESMIYPIDDLAEGVYMASGDVSGDCFTVTAYIHQSPEVGRGDYRIQVNARHDGDHNSNRHQQLILFFNQPVEYVSSNGMLSADSKPTMLKIDISYWQNHTDSIGMGDVIVRSDAGLAVTDAQMLDLAKEK